MDMMFKEIYLHYFGGKLKDRTQMLDEKEGIEKSLD
jgi:hypothetical protein